MIQLQLVKKLEPARRQLPVVRVLRVMLLPRFMRWRNERFGHMDGWTLILPFLFGALVIKSYSQDYWRHALTSGFEVWLWPNRVRYVEGDKIFCWEWRIEDTVYF